MEATPPQPPPRPSLAVQALEARIFALENKLRGQHDPIVAAASVSHSEKGKTSEELDVASRVDAESKENPQRELSFHHATTYLSFAPGIPVAKQVAFQLASTLPILVQFLMLFGMSGDAPSQLAATTGSARASEFAPEVRHTGSC